MNLKTIPILLLLATLSTQHPLPEDQPPDEESTETNSPSSSTYSPPSLVVIGDDSPDDTLVADRDSMSEKQKRHRPTPSPEELEERRKALIKALGGGGDDEDGGGGGGQIAASIMGLGSLATDVVSLLGSNANETFAPLREARQRAKENFPDLGTQLNNFVRSRAEYSRRAYRALLKNARVKVTNALRFMLSAVTRLTSTIGGLYQVVVSLLDVATRAAGTGARVGSRLLTLGSNATINAVARGTVALRNLAESGDLVKPVNQFTMVGRGLAKGVSEDLFDKVEWAQEGINSKLELVQAIAPNFLLRAHLRTSTTPEPSTPISPSYDAPPSDPIIEDTSGGGYSGGYDNNLGGYSKLTENEDELVLLSLASTASELMNREMRNADSKNKTTTEDPTKAQDFNGPNQSLLNDIFGLQEEFEAELKRRDEDINKTTTTIKPV